MRPRDNLCARLPIAVLMSTVMALAHAFEPGSERVCTPSADGKTFECREKSTGTIVEPEKKPVEPVAGAPKADVAPVATEMPVETASSPAPRPAASSLPSYLMQNPSAAATDDASPAPAPAEPSARTQPAVRKVEPAALPASPASVQAPAHAPADASPAKDNQAAANAAAQRSTDKPAPTAHSTAAPPPPAKDVPRALPEPETPRPSSPAARAQVAAPSAASAFLALPASEFTLVLASERNPSALDGLIRALDAQASQLYLLKLHMPDGDWYSLCWSAFKDLDAARAARASLPADAPVRSGWPRRIGLLQKEIAR